MKILTFLLLLFTSLCGAQSAVTGIVKDSETEQSLPFATIYMQNGKSIIADMDGKFVIEHAPLHEIFTVVYIGYEKRSLKITPEGYFYSVALEPKPELLNEIVIQGENPVTGIIKRAIRGRIVNDPQQKLNSFSYKTYERLVVTAEPDSISGTLDSIYKYKRQAAFSRK